MTIAHAEAVPIPSTDGVSDIASVGEESLVGTYRLHGRLVYPAVEHRPVNNLPLDQIVRGRALDLYEEVQKRDYLSIQMSDGRLILQASGCVGLLPLNDHVAIDIAPRAPIGNLMRLFEVSGAVPRMPTPRLLQRYSASADRPPSLVNVLTLAFLDAVELVAAQGLHRAYHQNVTDTSFPRGRIMVGETMRRHQARGATHRVTAAWHAHSADTPPNRCLKYTIWRLAVLYNQGKPAKKAPRKEKEEHARIIARLNRAYAYFAATGLDTQARFLADRLVTEPATMPAVRVYYAQALQLALIIIRNQGIAFGRSGVIDAPTFLIRLDEVFEAYVRKALAQRLPSVVAGVEVLDGNPGQPGNRPLFARGSDTGTVDKKESSTSPDIVVRRTAAVPPAPYHPVVIDVKYKEMPPKREDINQAIVYGVAYEARHTVLLYPYDPSKHTGDRLRQLGRIGDMILHRYFFDLAAPSLEEEEVAFATTIKQLIGGSSTGETA